MNGEGGAGRNRKRVPRVVAIIRSSAVQITLCFSLHDFVSSKVDFPGRETNHKPKNVVQILRQTRLYVLLPMRFISFFCIKNAMALNKILGPVPQFLYSRCLFADTHDTHLGDHPAAPCEAVDHWERGECTRPGETDAPWGKQTLF